MDKEWSQKNKEIQKLLNSKKTYQEGINELIQFRSVLFKQVQMIYDTYPRTAFDQMPYLKADGFHNKTLAYSIWHIMRIEDIVCHELICKDTQVFFRKNYQELIQSPIITTGNELVELEIMEFSKKLNLDYLMMYAKDVMEVSNQVLQQLSYEDFKRTFHQDDKDRILQSGCVSHHKDAIWLVDYWCDKDVKALLKMPFSRHWIMHIEAMRRIKNKLCLMARKGKDPIAYCGFSCNHCFLSSWCGSCRSEYNTCSFAMIRPNHICENVACCQEKGYDGCFECDNIYDCTKGFYTEGNDGANAAKAQALFIQKYGKKEMLSVHDQLHKLYDFKKTQEILTDDLKQGLEILESIYKKER